MRLSILSCGLVVCCFWISSLQAGEILEWSEDQMLSEKIRETPMPDTGDSRIGKILMRFYEKGLGGPENWESIVSMRSRGIIRLDSGMEMKMEAYQRKPNQMKLVLSQKERTVLTMAYDGEVAWRQVEGSLNAERMDPEETRRFIHSSMFGNHLLFPYAKGKRIEYMETIPVEETVCHKVRVHLDTGYQVDYYINVSDYHELRVDNLDLHTDRVNTIQYSDYTVVSGMPMALRVENSEDDKLLSALELEEFTVNIGIMPWMFRMPANIAEKSASSENSTP